MIDLGQLGDVVLSLPALRSVRERFPEAKITLFVGKAAGDLVRMAGVANHQIVVDRVALRDGNKAASVVEMFRIVSDVRRRKFDLVIDLHSLYETNLLGYLSGAKHRLFANRENRSFDRLSNFPVRPPVENKQLHHTDRYFQVLKPLGIERPAGQFRLEPPARDRDEARKLIETAQLTRPNRVGLFLGAGHPGRLWGLERFADLAERLSRRGDVDILAFLGPEEAGLRGQAEKILAGHAVMLKPMPLPTFAAVLGMLDTFVSTDTGPMHVAAIAGAAIVLIAVEHTPDYFMPLTEKLYVVKGPTVADVSVEEVYAAVAASLASE